MPHFADALASCSPMRPPARHSAAQRHDVLARYTRFDGHAAERIAGADRRDVDLARRVTPGGRAAVEVARVKALFLCQNLGVGGAEELILGASTALPTVGVETGVVALSRRGPIADEIAAAGVPVHLVAGAARPARSRPRSCGWCGCCSASSPTSYTRS